MITQYCILSYIKHGIYQDNQKIKQNTKLWIISYCGPFGWTVISVLFQKKHNDILANVDIILLLNDLCLTNKMTVWHI